MAAIGFDPNIVGIIEHNGAKYDEQIQPIKWTPQTSMFTIPYSVQYIAGVCQECTDDNLRTSQTVCLQTLDTRTSSNLINVKTIQ